MLVQPAVLARVRVVRIRPQRVLRIPAADAADAAAHLAYWSRLALFGRGDRLIEDQLRLAGAMREDLSQNRYWLPRDALAELHGPWSLEEHLANPGRQAVPPTAATLAKQQPLTTVNSRHTRRNRSGTNHHSTSRRK
jgi:hypothetical protein